MENKQLLQHIGKTRTDKLLSEINKEWNEDFKKLFPNYENSLKTHALVTSTKDGEIKSLGMSCKNDLLTNNFGIWYAHVLGQITPDFQLINNANISKDFRALGSGTRWNTTDANSVGCTIQVGSGLTPADRSDFNIETAFPTAPESGRINTGNGGWNSGLGEILFSMNPINAGGAGSISEACWFFHMTDNPASEEIILFSRDNISPVVPFIIGETINVQYSMVFN
jgi:hypothetical protein